MNLPSTLGSIALAYGERGARVSVAFALVAGAIVPVFLPRDRTENSAGAAIAAPENMKAADFDHTEPSLYGDGPLASVTRSGTITAETSNCWHLGTARLDWPEGLPGAWIG
jgi:hypothetical protein